MTLTRRTVLSLAGLAGFALGAPALLRQIAPLPQARPLARFPGFERLDTGTLNTPLATLGTAAQRPPEARLAAIHADPEAALFHTTRPNTVPIAVFTDVNCPNCRALSATFVAWATERTDLDITFHELPLLGPTSASAARLALAAELQGGYLAVHHRLMQSRFRPSPAFIRDVAADAGLDAARLSADLTAPEVEARLNQSAALAYAMGIPGTPAMVIGRTLVVGALDVRQINRLIRRAA